MDAAARRLIALGLIAVVGGCEAKQLEVVSDERGAADDYGHADLMAAVAEMALTPTSPVAYRKLAVRTEELRPRFNERVSDQAELELAFLALGPLAAGLPAPTDEQLAALATTVWPTALRVEPTPGDTPRQYLERVCTGALAGDCKYVVPEAWPIVLGAFVWRTMKTRARDAYADCSLCGLEPSYEQALEAYERHDTAAQAKVAVLRDRVEPGFWPRAGDHTEPWSSAPLLELGADTVSFDGEEIGEDEWRRLIEEQRGKRAVLGVHLRPRQETRILRAALADAARAGWAEVALQVREGTYPWNLRQYRIATRRRGAGLAVREVDSIQVLVRALDAAAARLVARGDEPRGPINL